MIVTILAIACIACKPPAASQTKASADHGWGKNTEAIATLQDLMEFYNKRDLEPERWGTTDFPETVNHKDLGNLGLTDQQVADLVALMEAFTDRSLLTKEVREHNAFPETPPGVPSTESMEPHFPMWTHRLQPTYKSNPE